MLLTFLFLEIFDVFVGVFGSAKVVRTTELSMAELPCLLALTLTASGFRGSTGNMNM